MRFLHSNKLSRPMWLVAPLLAILPVFALISLTPPHATTATPTIATDTASAITLGYLHTCALTTDGGVKCWGSNQYGQLGDSTTVHRPTPIDVTGLNSGVMAVSAGQDHTCALTNAGGVKCWGSNGSGQLGNGTNTNSSTPIDVPGLTSGVEAISAGGAHTCALLSGGAVHCWGFDNHGQLGAPVLTSFVAISGGGQHTCGLTTAGGIKCWGDNSNGQLGNGSNTDSRAPVDVTGLTSGVVAVSAGGFHTCAISAIGGLSCWGNNFPGQLGDGMSCGSNCNAPVDVSGLASGTKAVNGGAFYTCGLTVGGGVKCWGSNSTGQLGDGTTSDRTTPVDVTGMNSGVLAVSAESRHTCALTSIGGIKCWGENSVGQLGDGTTAGTQTCQVQFPCTPTPVDVIGFGPAPTPSASPSPSPSPVCPVDDDDFDDDGRKNRRDRDDDNDGIRDGRDRDDDNDGLRDRRDADDDNDTIPDRDDRDTGKPFCPGDDDDDDEEDDDD